MEVPVERVLAAAITGQAQSLRFIQHQLSNLHAALAKANEDIKAAIKGDSRLSSSEIEIQYSFTLEVVARLFDQNQFEPALEKEYKFARTENTPDNLIACGVAYIEPSRYNLVYSCITAVAAAVAAGNCVILQIPRTSSRTSEILIQTLSNALDRDTFVVSTEKLDGSRLPKRVIRLYASPSTEISSMKAVLTVPNTRTVAIVDRYADLRQAAGTLLRARFSFGGQSPIAPHLVLINEYKLKDFCLALAEQSSKYFATQVEMSNSVDHSAIAQARAIRKHVQQLEESGAEIISSGSRGCIARVTDRNSYVLRNDVTEPLLIIHPVSSMDDAIDFVNGISDDQALAALHIFGDPEVGKYISQFVHSHLTCVNDIPVELLVAPLTPVGFATKLDSPYHPEMFSIPKPQYIQFDEKSRRTATLIDNNDQAGAAKMTKQALLLDTKVKQPAGHAIGFFEQGLIVGGCVALTSIVSGSILLWRYGLPTLLKLRG